MAYTLKILYLVSMEGDDGPSGRSLIPYAIIVPLILQNPYILLP